MRAMLHRLRRIEAKLAPAKAAEDWRSLEAAELIRERRRRRMEAAGLPFTELPPLPADYDGPQRALRKRFGLIANSGSACWDRANEKRFGARQSVGAAVGAF